MTEWIGACHVFIHLPLIPLPFIPVTAICLQPALHEKVRDVIPCDRGVALEVVEVDGFVRRERDVSPCAKRRTVGKQVPDLSLLGLASPTHGKIMTTQNHK